jgi:aryl-alcohol dehydrogenase-like predicted oxidoreductase
MRMSQIIDAETGAATPISVLGVGCSKVGSLGNPAPSTQVRETLAKALSLGVTVFDTADIYGQGDSEREIGRLLRGRRDAAFVVTKFGKTFSRTMRLMRPLKPLLRLVAPHRAAGSMISAQRDRVVGEDFDPARLEIALDASLRRLGFDYVDAVLLHSPPADVAADAAVASRLAAIKAAGKARHFGVSCDDRATVEAALAMPGLSLVQMPLDVIIAGAADGLMSRLRQARITVFAREAIRLRGNLTPPQAVAAAARRPDVDCVIAGASHPDRLAQLAAAL